MKKATSGLTLSRETVRTLDSEEALRIVAGEVRITTLTFIFSLCCPTTASLVPCTIEVSHTGCA